MSEKQDEPQCDVEIEVETSPPQSAEDHVLVALEKGGLDEVVRVLRDWCGSNDIRASLNRLPHRDPVSPFTHIYRLAVELYAKCHGLTPAAAMAKIRGTGHRKDPLGAERFKLRKAREYVGRNPAYGVGAAALARHWEDTRPANRDPVKHLVSKAPDI